MKKNISLLLICISINTFATVKRYPIYINNYNYVGINNDCFGARSSTHPNWSSDTIAIKKNTIYIRPTGMIYTDWVPNAFWLPIGYDYQINKKQFIGFEAGAIIAYEKATWHDLPASPAEKITGYSINIEHKIVLKKRLYYSTNLLYRNTKFYEKEILSNGNEHTYFIINNIGSINAKVGFALFSHNHIYTDFSIGIGVKYISGKTFDRLAQPTIFLTDSYGNIFGNANAFKLNFALQFKVGYNF